MSDFKANVNKPCETKVETVIGNNSKKINKTNIHLSPKESLNSDEC
jgi:hypothetical protein